MAKQTTPRQVSQGICTFCQGEFPKNKFTQHLKTCKARQELSAGQEGKSERLFHLQVEGKYRPEYWMHLELPASAALADLDDFLRYVWLECCGHLSEFTIKGESYSNEHMDDWDLGNITLIKEPGADGEEIDEDEELEEEEDEEGEEEFSMEEIATEMSKQLSLEFQTDLKNVPVSEIEKKLESLFAENMPPGMATGALPMLRPLLTTMAESLQQGTLAQDLAELEEEEEEEEGGMLSELGDVLEVGDRFSYVYDFGSSSTLSFRVIAEREGVVPVPAEEEEGEEDHAGHDHAGHVHAGHDHEGHDHEEDEEEDEVPILIMARNAAPALTCHICGKPATSVPSLSEYVPLAEVALCETHAQESEYPDELLPIVNSPRTGICGYTGDEFEDEWDEEDEEFEDVEDDE